MIKLLVLDPQKSESLYSHSFEIWININQLRNLAQIEDNSS